MIHWIPFYIEKYERDTKDLTLVEHGAYLKLLLHCWGTGQGVPLDEPSIFRIASAFTREEQEAVRKILDKFFVKKSNGFFNKTAQKILKEQNEKRRKLSDNGRRGGLAKAKAIAKDLPKQNSAIKEIDKDIDLDKNNHDLKKYKRPKNTAFSDQHLTLAKLIFDKIQELNPGHKEPNFHDWANEIRLIEERDGHPPSDVWELFLWAHQDPFWQKNILSPGSLRRHWDKLVIQRNTNKPEPQKIPEPKWKRLKQARFVVPFYEKRKVLDLNEFSDQPVNIGGVLYFVHKRNDSEQYAVNDLVPEKEG